MLKFPEHITIAGQKYKVIFPYHFKERSDYSGQTDHALLEIRISDVDCCGNSKPDSFILVSFWHEVFHCIDILYCMDKLGKEEEKENIVEALAIGLTQVLIENNLLKEAKQQ